MNFSKQPRMQRRSGMRAWRGAAIVALLLVYALPLFAPPPAVPVARLPPTAPLLARLFPDVPGWWVVARLVALAAAALLAARGAAEPVVRLRSAPRTPHWRDVWLPRAALAAALAHACALPWRAGLTPIGQTVFMLGFAVAPALLAWGAVPAVAARTRPGARLRAPAIAIAVLIVGWIAFRAIAGWHSPRAADLIDMWRIFGGFTRLAATNGNFLTQPLDADLPGLSAILLFFHGLPLLQIAGAAPTLTWMQLGNAAWLAVAAGLIAALTARLVGRAAAIVAAAAFLFSPFALSFQLSPMPTVEVVVPALAGLLLTQFFASASPAALVLLAAVVGVSAGMPPLIGLTALAALFAAWRAARRPRVAPIVAATAVLSLGTAVATSVPAPRTMLAMYAQYAATEVPLAVAEPAVHGQMAPTIEDWLGGPLPPDVPLAQLASRGIPITRGWLLVPLGALLAPFAVARWSLRLWGDAMFEPWSAGLAALGLAACLRFARRDAPSRAAVLFLLAALAPAFVSSYDRVSLLRLLGAPVPVALLAGAGFALFARALAGRGARLAAAIVTAAVIAVSGTVLFDIVTPRLLAASSLGLLVRAVPAGDLDRTALLTASGRDPRPDVPPGRRYWDLDWLRHNHPYIDDVVAWTPQRPIPVIDIDRLGDAPDRTLIFWAPALEQTVGVRARLCAAHPAATVYTIGDASGLSRVYAADLNGRAWTPAVPQTRWTAQPCAEPS
jgi:hypothetical protein